MRPFRHRAAFWAGIAVLAVFCVLVVGMETGVWGLLAGLALATLPVPLYTGLALWLDRFEAEPAPLLVRSFAWGAIVAVLLSALVNSAVESVTGSRLAAEVVSAPVTEELCKGFVLFFLFVHYRDEFDNVTDGVVYAAMVGLGFAMTENALYYGHALAQGNTARAFILRGVIAPYAHPLFTALTGIGFGIAREADRRGTRICAPLVGLAGAIGLHGFWNLAASRGGVFGPVYLVVMMPTLAAVLLTVRRSLAREAETIRRELQPLVEMGDLPAAELERLCASWPRLRASWAALREGGLRSWRARRRFHQAASELAFHRWRVARGIRGDAAMELRREREYLAALRSVRRPATHHRTGTEDEP